MNKQISYFETSHSKLQTQYKNQNISSVVYKAQNAGYMTSIFLVKT